MNDKVKGIVLSISDYKDNDQMLHVLTDNYGLLSLVAKSSKKISSKQHFFEGCFYEFIIDYKDLKTIYSIHGSKLIKAYYDIDDVKLFSFKNILLDASYKSKELIEQETFNNLLFTLDNLNNQNKYLIGSLYFSYLLRLHGINPNVDECVVCKNKKVVGISNTQGGFLCINHIVGEKILDVTTLKKFRLISKAQFKDYEIIKNNEYNYEDFELIVNFFISNSSINLKTFEFYKNIV